MVQMLRYLQRTAGNQAVNTLLRQYHPRTIQRIGGPSDQQEAAPQPTPLAGNPVAAAMWETSVVTPLKGAQKTLSGGPRRAKETLEQVQSTETALNAVGSTVTPEEHPLEHARIKGVDITLTSVEAELETQTGDGESPETISQAFEAVGTEADGLTDSLDTPAPAPAAAPSTPPAAAAPPSGNQPKIAAALWQATVVTPLKTAKDDFTKAAADAKSKPKDFTRIITVLGSIFESVTATRRAFKGDPLIAQKLLNVNQAMVILIALLGPLAKKKVSIKKIAKALDLTIREATDIEVLLKEGSQPAPAPTP